MKTLSGSRNHLAQTARAITIGLWLGVTLPAWATFHEMQIEQVIGSVNGDTSAQAVQLRMRAPGQNLVSGARLVAYDAAGLNPVVVVDFASNVANGSTGDRVLITSPTFAPYTGGAVASDFTMANLIPASYLSAGRLTLERDTGEILWSLSWGGTNYTGSTSGALDNDANGEFGPSFAESLATDGVQAVQFQGSAGAPSTDNQTDYALTADASQWINNAGSSFTLLGGLYVVSTTNDSGAGSLRAAILQANAYPGTITIHFSIPPFDGTVKTIALDSGLPAITAPVTMDGYTQPGASANTLTNGNDAVLLIELDGSNAGQANGLVITGGGSTVRGLVINRFLTPCCSGFGYGIILRSNSNNVVEGNFIGTDSTGTNQLQNGGTGVVIADGSSNNRIGGATPAARNLISGNGTFGVDICCSEDSNNNRILGNYIGTDKNGTVAVGNNSAGVRIGYSANNTVGGTDLSARNVISGNHGNGVTLAQIEATGNLVQGNLIGTAFDGISPLGNLRGISFFNAASSNVIGGTVAGAGNVIAFNDAVGIEVGGGAPANGLDRSNAILGNSIFSNGDLGIDLLDTNSVTFVTPNDGCDTDTGANHLQNFPVLTAASNSAAGIVIQGTLDGAPNATFRVEFFANTECDPSGYGEGEQFIGFTNVTTDAGCMAAFEASLAASVDDGAFITATATDADNNTSEFSQCIEIAEPPPVVLCSLSPSSGTNFLGSAHTVTATVTSNGAPASGVIVDFAVTAGPNTNAADSVATDVNGTALFTYTGSGGEGADSITATGIVAGVAFSCEATKLWLPLNPDLIVTKSASPSPVIQGSNLTYTVFITNAGPVAATGVTVTDALPANVTFVMATPGCTNIAGTVVCDLGTLASGGVTGITISVTSTNLGPITNTVNVAANETDAFPADNTAQTITDVISGLPDLMPQLSNVVIVCSSGVPNGTFCNFSGALTLKNRGVAFATGALDFDTECKKCPDSVKWKLTGTFTVSTLDTTGIAEHGFTLYLSNNGVLDDNDLKLSKKAISLSTLTKAFNGGKPVKLKAKVPSGTELTGKFLIFAEDDDDVVDESNETNNNIVFGPLQ